MFLGYGLCCIFFASAAVEGAPLESTTEKAMPYEYNYKVEDTNSSTYYGAEEKGNEAGRVDGSYYVWLPDKRLMKVSYYVEGDSGFVPQISFEDNANPIGKTKK